MSTPLSPTRLFQCDHCQARLPFDAAQAGQRCRCGRCGKILVVPGPDQDAKRRSPQSIGFYCRNCQTRLSARAEDAGRQAKCPDCGARRVVPPPPKPRPQHRPRAMHGQQYDLWGVDEAPLPEELAARQPKLVPVFCRVCDTLMRALPRQVGQEMTCPDCGAKTVAREPPPEEEAETVLVPDGEEYQLDPAEAPPPRPVAAPSTVREAPREAKSGPSYRDTLEREYGARSQLPRVPLVQGVFSMLLRRPVPAWWIGLSAPLVGIDGLAMLFGTQHPFIAVCCLALAFMVGAIAFGAGAALCIAILTDSSEGNDQLYNPPLAAPQEWMGAALYVGLAIGLSLIPGSVVGRLTNQPLLGTSAGFFICFPILLLSSLEQGSPLGVFSPKVFASLARRPGHWLMFYLVTALLLGGVAWASRALAELSLLAAVAMVPVVVGAVLLFFRLLGRHAWWLAESLPDEVSQD